MNTRPVLSTRKVLSVTINLLSAVPSIWITVPWCIILSAERGGGFCSGYERGLFTNACFIKGDSARDGKIEMVAAIPSRGYEDFLSIALII